MATSIDDPPPKPITPEALNSLPISTTLIKVLSEGSASTRSKIMISEFFFKASTVSLINPNFFRPGSVINKIFLPSLSETSNAVSVARPLPTLKPAVVLN